MHRSLLLLLLLLPVAGAAQVYRTTDENGNVVFTDAPPPGVVETEQIEIQPTNTVTPPPAQPQVKKQSQGEPEAVPVSVRIMAPANETSLPMGPGNFPVSAKVQPSLGKNESLQLYIDGIPWSGPQRETSWALTNIFRGAHDLTVDVIDDSGQSIAKSEPVRVFVHRPSVNFRKRN